MKPDSDIDQSDRFLRTSAAGTRNPRDRDRRIRAGPFRNAVHHLFRALPADCANLFQSLPGNPEKVHLQIIGVGDHAAEKVFRRTGNFRQLFRDQSPCAGLRRRQQNLPLPEQAEHLLRQRENPVRQALLLKQIPDNSFHLLQLLSAARGQKHLDHSRRRAVCRRDLRIQLLFQAILNLRLSDSDDPEQRRMNSLFLLLLSLRQQRQHRAFKHRLQLRRRSRQKKNRLPVPVQTDSRRGTESVRHHLRSFRNLRLADPVDRRNPRMTVLPVIPDGLFRFRTADQRNAEPLRHRTFCPIIVGRPESSGEQDGIGFGERVVEGLPDRLPAVRNFQRHLRNDPDLQQFPAEKR